MPYHIFINRESGNDNISIFYDEPTFVVIANKDDLPAIQLIEESQKPGIYILLGDKVLLQSLKIKYKVYNPSCS